MATSNKVFVSPGVYTSERDLSFVAQSVGVTTLGLVGETISGPAFEPIFITNFDEFQSYFGGTNPTKFVNTQIPKYEAAYIAKSYLQQSNQLFVTRVLGLSGYDAGPSWSIKTIGNLDSTGTTATSVSGPFTIAFSGVSGTSTSTAITNYGGLPASILGVINHPYETYTGGESTLEGDFKKYFYQEIANPANSGSTSYFWGAVSASTYSSITGASSTPNYTGNTNVLAVNNVQFENNVLNASVNDPWYYALFTENSGVYNGTGFGFGVTTLTNTGGLNYEGTAEVYITNYTGTPMSEYHDLVVGTLRSRGIDTYTTDDGPVYEVSGLTDVMIDCTGAFSAISTNPFATFGISGLTADSDTFTFNTSFNIANSNYVSKVFGKSNFAKPKSEVPLFLEEEYYNLLNTGYRLGKVRGLDCSLTALPSARGDAGTNTSIGWYLDRYQTPETPYLVSELRGNKVYNMFKFLTVSDGNSANKEVKVSIMNISFNNGTFDVAVRDFFDTDANPVILEKFTNCTMDVNQNSFVAKKIGTSNGDFELRSRFIMLEMNEDAPMDSLPCGFRGYETRQYSGVKSPFLEYKTKYDTPGEVIWNPPFGSATGTDNETRSSGDRVRRTFLGVSNTVGIDSDFFQYKGKQNPTNLATATDSQPWSYLTKGYHMDSGATVITISSNYVTSGETAFEVGDASFDSEPQEGSPYYRLNARKFTIAPSGGFDGWDIYREYRTNGDRYQLGAAGFRKGAAPSISYPTATGWGAFKQITGPDQLTWANTDYYAYLWGQYTFNNPESVNINVFATPNIDYVNNSNLVESAIDMVEQDRADSVYICTTPDYQMFTPTLGDFDTNFIYPEEAVDNLEDTGIDSNYTATYYPWILTRDSVNNTQIYLPPTGEVVRNLALTDNIAFPWFATAGYTRGLVNSVKARKKLTQEDRDTLYQGRLNPIATFSDVGTVIWGNKTLQVKESALDRINVRRLLLQARKLISAVAVRLLFEQNDEQVRQEFLDSVNPILDSIRRDRGLIDFRVTVSGTPEDLDSNTLTGKIYLKPTRALEFIDIEFLITPTGASFEDI
jgi:hypothetical protein